MQDKLREQLKQFLGYIVWDCFHNDIKLDDSACNGVTNYIFNGVGGDNKLFEIWIERFNELIDQNFIGKEELRKEIKMNISVAKMLDDTFTKDGYILGLEKLLELLK